MSSSGRVTRSSTAAASASASASASSSTPTTLPSSSSSRRTSRASSRATGTGTGSSRKQAIVIISDDEQIDIDSRPMKRVKSTAKGESTGKATNAAIVVGSDSSDEQVTSIRAAPTKGTGLLSGMINRASTSKAASAPQSTSSSGVAKWKQDAYELVEKYGSDKWVCEGYVGMEGTFSNFRMDSGRNTFRFTLEFEDMDGRNRSYHLAITGIGLMSYPTTYRSSITTALTTQTPSLKRVFDRFKAVSKLNTTSLLRLLLQALQGDDEARGGKPVASHESSDSEPELDLTDEEHGGDDDEIPDSLEAPGRGFEVAKGSEKDLGLEWARVKDDFSQAKKMGYRPGLLQVSDYWVISYSIPFKNIDIDPNELATWDDGLIEAWQGDQRFTMLIRADKYGASPDQMQFFLLMDPNYKPSDEQITSITRSKHDTSTKPKSISNSFFLSDSLSTHLRLFPRAYHSRSAFSINWQTADKYALDPLLSAQVLESGKEPVNSGPAPTRDDPIESGYSGNIPLVAFFWALRRFVHATKYCLNCGREVVLQGLRPYVCDDALCLWSMMTLGLGPSVAHTIRTHPGVCDVLLSFAHAAVNHQSMARNVGVGHGVGIITRKMDIPDGLSILVPAEGSPTGAEAELDTMTEDQKRRALSWLIESLPPISKLKAYLDEGSSLSELARKKIMHEGALTVLRWVICSCRAYLKESKPGEGVVNTPSTQQAHHFHGAYDIGSNIRQFTFVVGSPEQEDNFKREIETAKVAEPTLGEFPTLLAFHGSAMGNWHNILRTGLNYDVVVNGRAYGNGVYFAANAETSMGGYAAANTLYRPNADFNIQRATALVEIVNVPETFVSSNPYYVVDKIKQIKPFLLLLQGAAPSQPSVGPVDPNSTGAIPSGPASTTAVAGATAASSPVSRKGRLFKHDPQLRLKTTYFGQALEVMMPEKLSRLKYIDKQPDTPSDQNLYIGQSNNKSSSSISNTGGKSLSRNGSGSKGDAKTVNRPTYMPATPLRYAKLQLMPNPTYTSPAATKAVMREWKVTVKAQENGELPFWLVTDADRIYSWSIEMFEFPGDSILAREMKQKNVRSIIAEIRFPDSFPASPPFIRILHPRFLPFSMGGGGNITAGGSVCNEILTSSGWNPCFTIEAMVRDVMVNMTQATPPARLDHRWDTPYSVQEAIDAYKRVASVHGWEIPKNFDKIAL